MKKRTIGMALTISLLCTACHTASTVQQSTDGSIQVTEHTSVAESVTQSDRQEETETSSGKEDAEQAYYEIKLEAETLDQEAVAEAIFGTDPYEKEQQGNAWVYATDDGAGLIFYTEKEFRYTKPPYHIRYQALTASGWGAVMLQDMRLESLFPEEELPNGGKEEAEQACDRVMEAVGYDYTEKRIYALDPEFGNLMGISSPEEGQDTWQEEEGAYLVIYRNGKLVDVDADMAFVDVNSVCYMVYSPKYGLCDVFMEPVFHEVSRQEVEVLTEEEAKTQTVNLFQMYGLPYSLVEVTGYELVYCENPYARDDEMTTSSVVPCWKISFRPKESDETLWQSEGFIARGTSTSEGYLILDARVGGSIKTFYPSPD